MSLPLDGSSTSDNLFLISYMIIDFLYWVNNNNSQFQIFEQACHPWPEYQIQFYIYYDLKNDRMTLKMTVWHWKRPCDFENDMTLKMICLWKWYDFWKWNFDPILFHHIIQNIFFDIIKQYDNDYVRLCLIIIFWWGTTFGTLYLHGSYIFGIIYIFWYIAGYILKSIQTFLTDETDSRDITYHP